MTEVGRVLATVIAVASVVLGCSGGGETAAERSSTTAGAVLEAESAGTVDLTALRPTDARSVALVSPGDQLLVADGRFNDDGDEAHLRVWVAPATDPTRAATFDLEELGPRSQLHVHSWNDDVVMTGVRCPEPFVTPEPDSTIEAHTNEELCGSTVWDAWTFDPRTGDVRMLLAAVDIGPEATLHPVAATDERVLLAEGNLGPNPIMSIAPDGTVERFDGPTASVPSGASVGATMCAVGDVVFSLTPSDIEREAPGQTIERPLDDYFVLHRLDGDRWLEEPLPDAGYTAAFATDTGCTDEGLVVSSSPGTRYTSIPNPPLVLHPTADDASLFAWLPVPTEVLATPAERLAAADPTLSLVEGVLVGEAGVLALVATPDGPALSVRLL